MVHTHVYAAFDLIHQKVASDNYKCPHILVLGVITANFHQPQSQVLRTKGSAVTLLQYC